MEYNSDEDLLSGPDRDLSGFIIPGSASAAGFGSPSSSGFGSPYSKVREQCHHSKKRNSCRMCWEENNALRVSQGLEPVSWGIFCKHGINKFTKFRCTDPECTATRPYTYKSPPHTSSVMHMRTEQSPQPSYKQGVIPESARMFEPSIPSSAGLSFSELESTEIKPVSRNLLSDMEMEQGGGRKSYRKSAKKLKRKSKKSSRKAKRSSRKAKRSSRR